MGNSQVGHGTKNKANGKGVHRGAHPTGQRVVVKGGPIKTKPPIPNIPPAVKTGASKHHLDRKLDDRPRLYVLDTNVLMHDPNSLLSFEEHDVFIPMMVLEELDNNKKGNTEVARNARQTGRLLDAILHDPNMDMTKGIPLSSHQGSLATGNIFLEMEIENLLLDTHAHTKGDNKILGAMKKLKDLKRDHQIILVSKDINMRIKARALGFPAEDYFNDKVLEDSDLLYTGTKELTDEFWEAHAEKMEAWKDGTSTFHRFKGAGCRELHVNQFVFYEGAKPFYGVVREQGPKTAVIELIHDFSHKKNAVWGVTARNREQNFALNMLMDPEVDFVTLLGKAGSGKTLLTLAAALQQTLDDKRYTEIIMTRVTVPVGEDIGFLPGSEEEKMSPWMGALEDNLDVLNVTSTDAGEWGRAATQDLIRSRIKVKSLNFIRGRSFLSKFLIIDEAQNLTPKQMKTLITRAGPGTKVVCLGNLAQIDTPYLTEGSSGLTYVVDRFRGWEHGGHVMLEKGERSRLADHANEVL